jgi:hypothetical protein
MSDVRRREFITLLGGAVVLNETRGRSFTVNVGVGRLSTTTGSCGARHPNQSANSTNSFTLRTSHIFDCGISWGTNLKSLARRTAGANARPHAGERSARRCPCPSSRQARTQALLWFD